MPEVGSRSASAMSRLIRLGVVRSALALPGAGPLQALPQVLGVGRDVAAERMVRAR